MILYQLHYGSVKSLIKTKHLDEGTFDWRNQKVTFHTNPVADQHPVQ